MLQRAILEDQADTGSRELRSAPQPRRRPGSRGPGFLRSIRRLAGHSIFVPALTIWGAAMGGLSVMMLPAYTIVRIMILAQLSALGNSAQYVFAGLAAFIGAAICWTFSTLLRSLLVRDPYKRSVVNMAARRVRPIDPSEELGSDSLDAPIEEVPFHAKADGREYRDFDLDAGAPLKDEFELPPEAEIAPEPVVEEERKPRSALDRIKNRKNPTWEKPISREEAGLPPLPETEPATEGVTEIAPEPAPEPVAEPAAESEPEPAPQTAFMQDSTPVRGLTEPVAPLDLGSFSEMPLDEGEPLDLDALELRSTEIVPDPDPAASTDPIAKLRQVPPAELSLVQMVERFAAALHEFQSTAQLTRTEARPVTHPSGQDPERDQALAEALKALALFSERGLAQTAPANADTAPAQSGSRFGNQFSGQSARRAAAPRSEPAGDHATIISDTERELREALARLTDLRGAA